MNFRELEDVYKIGKGVLDHIKAVKEGRSITLRVVLPQFGDPDEVWIVEVEKQQ